MSIFWKIRAKGGLFIVEIQLVVAAFAVIGGGLKYIDEAFDEGTFNKRIATVLASFLIVIWLGLSMLDPTSGTILLAVLLGVVFTGKIDNSVFEMSTATIFGALVLLGKFLIAPLLLLSATGIIDEKGNDYVDNSKSSNKFVKFFFLHRFTMKLGLLLVCLSGFFAIEYFISFLFFDIAYDSVGIVSSAYSEGIVIEKDLGIDYREPTSA
jgi:hypothetical protein